MPRILLGKLCYNEFIKKQCTEIKHTLEDLKSIADIYLEVDHTEADEYVFQKVMLEYPTNLIENNGNLIKIRHFKGKTELKLNLYKPLPIIKRK